MAIVALIYIKTINKGEKDMNWKIGCGIATACGLFFTLVLGLALMGKYNTLVRSDEAVTQQWSNVESVYQRRLDLLPNLANVVERYAKHEAGTLEIVAKARSMKPEVKLTQEVLENPESLKKFQAAQGEIASLVSRLISITENYPNLKADRQFENLFVEVTGSENRISVERRRYNEAVFNLNSDIRSIFGSFANIFAGVQRRTPFKADEAASKAPTLMKPI